MKETPDPSKADEIGQMLKDIADYVNNGKELRVRWDFSPELAAAGMTAKHVADKFLKLLTDGKNPTIRSNVEQAIGISGLDKTVRDQQWEAFIEDFEPKMRAGLFKIEDYANISAQLGF